MRVILMPMMLMRVVMPVGELLATALIARFRVLALVPAGDSLASRSVAAVTAFDIAVSHRGTAALTRAATATAPTTTASTPTPTSLASALTALAFSTPFLAFRTRATRKCYG